MDLDLGGRRAVVTGGSSGIGLAVGRALAAEGAHVALVARTEDRLRRAAEQAAADLRATVVAVPADTGDDASVQAMVRTVHELLGGVDILVNAAATPNTQGFGEDELEAVLNVKLRGYLRTSRALAPEMAERGWGRIINIGGLAARQTGSVVGTVRNAAVAAMTKNLADELGPRGINVTVVHPGMTVTERTAQDLTAMAAERGVPVTDLERTLVAGSSIGRLVRAAEVADVVAFLASPRSVALNGDAVVASGGRPGAIYY